MELMLSLTLRLLSQRMFLEQPCFFRIKEDLEVLKSWVKKTVCVWPAAAWTLCGRDYSRSIVLHFCSGLHLQPPFLCFPSGVGGTLWVCCVGKGNGLPPLLLTEAVLLSALCVYLEKSKHPMCVYSLTQLFGIVQFLPRQSRVCLVREGNLLLTQNSGELCMLLVKETCRYLFPGLLCIYCSTEVTPFPFFPSGVADTWASFPSPSFASQRLLFWDEVLQDFLQRDFLARNLLG